MESGRSIYIHYIIKTINSSSFFFEEAKDVILREKHADTKCYIITMFQAYGKCSAHIKIEILWHEISFYLFCESLAWALENAIHK